APKLSGADSGEAKQHLRQFLRLGDHDVVTGVDIPGAVGFAQLRLAPLIELVQAGSTVDVGAWEATNGSLGLETQFLRVARPGMMLQAGAHPHDIIRIGHTEEFGLEGIRPRDQLYTIHLTYPVSTDRHDLNRDIRE